MANEFTPSGETVPLRDVERTLARMLNEVKEPGEGPAQVVRMSNLVIYCNKPAIAEAIAAEVPGIVAVHPARVLLLLGEAGADGDVTASVNAWCQKRGSQKICSEQITLHATGGAVERLPFAVRSLVLGDLPINLWWSCNQPPPLAGPLLLNLVERTQQIIYDSLDWPDPARGVAATAKWLEQVEQRGAAGEWRVASDLNWRRLKYWRRLVAQALDPSSAPGAAETITEISVEHGPEAIIQAWLLISWLTTRLKWQVLTGRVQPRVEILWRFLTGAGEGRVRVKRIDEGPATIRRVALACKLQGKPVQLVIRPEGANRLAVAVEGLDAEPRTVTTPPQTAAELIGRQLSDREPDPVFRQSMMVADTLARSLST